MPLVRPVTTRGDAAPLRDPAAPPSLEVHVAVKPVIALPLFEGATNASEICVFPRVAVGCSGASGTVAGTVAAEAGEAAPVPFPFVAVTVHVYVLPLVRGATDIGDEAPSTEPGVPPSDETQPAVKNVIALPLFAGAANATLITPLPWVTVGVTGALGAPGITASLATDSLLSPLTFVA